MYAFLRPIHSLNSLDTLFCQINSVPRTYTKLEDISMIITSTCNILWYPKYPCHIVVSTLVLCNIDAGFSCYTSWSNNANLFFLWVLVEMGNIHVRFIFRIFCHIIMTTDSLCGDFGCLLSNRIPCCCNTLCWSFFEQCIWKSITAQPRPDWYLLWNANLNIRMVSQGYMSAKA